MHQIITLEQAAIGTGFRAFGLRGRADPTLVDPFIGTDRVWMSEPTFPQHPHAGFSAISYVFEQSETGINNRDSLGTQNLIEPGGLHWTAAGHGVVHQEDPLVPGQCVRMLQIFVNLPESKQQNAPYSMSLAAQDTPQVWLPGVRIRVPLGRFQNVESPVVAPTDVMLLDISMQAGAAFDLPIPAGQNVFVMAIEGQPEIDGERFAGDQLRVPAFAAQKTQRVISVKAGAQSAQIVVFAGTPLRQTVVWGGSMAMASEAALAAVVADYRAGRLGHI